MSKTRGVEAFRDTPRGIYTLHATYATYTTRDDSQEDQIENGIRTVNVCPRARPAYYGATGGAHHITLVDAFDRVSILIVLYVCTIEIKYSTRTCFEVMQELGCGLF